MENNIVMMLMTTILIVVIIPSKITKAADFSTKFTSFSRCLWSCNIHDCIHHIPPREIKEFGVCLGTCMEKNCHKLLKKRKYADSLYTACTVGCTKSTIGQHTSYGKYKKYHYKVLHIVIN